MHRIPVLICCASLAVLAHSAQAQPCGVSATLFRDGVEADAQPPPVALQSAAPLALTLDPGLDGATVAATHADVSGSFDGPSSTGIAIAGNVAYRTGRRWLLSGIALQPGPNTLSVNATSLTGVSVTRTVTLWRDERLLPPARLVVETPGKHAPAGVRMRLDIRPGTTIARMRLDYDGDGRIDLDSTDIDVPLQFVFNQPGFYLAHARLDLATTPPTEHDAYARVLVRHVGETRAALCAAYDHMRARLLARDIDGALRALHPRLHGAYRSGWAQAGATLPDLARQLGFVADGVLSRDFAELLIARSVSGQAGRFLGYRVHLDIGSDGVWRIGSM